MSLPRKKIKAPSPRTETAPVSRKVEVPPTVGAQDTDAGAGLPLQKTRAYFREEEFTRVLRQQGKHVLWRKALLCPCMNTETTQALLNCPDCNGSGYVYVDPMPIQTIMLMFDRSTSIYERFGLWQEGSVQFTTEPQHRLSYRDSIEMLDSVMTINELLTKGERRGRKRTLPEHVDSARFRITKLTKLLYRTTAGVLTALEQGVHVEVTMEGWLRWLPVGRRTVPDGSIISVHYDYHPVFIILSWMHATRDVISGRKTSAATPRVISLPVASMGKLLFLADTTTVPSLEPIVSLPAGFGPTFPPDVPIRG